MSDIYRTPTQVAALFNARDMASFVPAVFEFLTRVTRCDFTSVLYRSAGNALLTERDSRGNIYSPRFMRRYAELTPAVPLVLANPGIKVLPTRRGLPATRRALQKTNFYREVMQPQGWRHAVALCFWGNPRGDFPVVVVTVNRHDGRRDFTDRELARLDAVHPIVEAAVARLLERSTTRAVVGGLAANLRHMSHGLLVLDAQGRVVLANTAARRACDRWIGTIDGRPRRQFRVPPAVQDVCSELLREWREDLRTDRRQWGRLIREVTSNSGVASILARVALDRRTCATGTAPTFFIELYDHAHQVGGVPPPLNHELGSTFARMTAAERETVGALVEGLSNKEIADRLGKSVQAVKFLLHSVYKKCGLSNRTKLVAVLRARDNTVSP